MKTFVLGLTLLLTLAACADDSGSDELIESLDFLNEGWASSSMAISMCNLWSDTEGCLSFAEYLDRQGCPIGAFTFGDLILSDADTDPLTTGLAVEWGDVGTRYGCEIDLAGFLSASG